MLGRYFEDIAVGDHAELGSYTFTRENILAFARQFDPQPFHVDDDAAAKGPFGRLAASGWHTAAAWMKCYVATNQKALADALARGEEAIATGPSPGFANLRWIRPVFPGDTLHFSCRATAKRMLISRPDWGLLESINEGRDAEGHVVYAFEGKVLVKKRG